MKYKKLQNEKDDELAVLNDEINRLKRELDVNRDHIQQYQQEIGRNTSTHPMLSLTKDIYGNNRGEQRKL
jgi:hypothetical protein